MKKNATLINMENYERRDHFQYFKQLAYPYMGVTCDVDITDFLNKVKTQKMPFFLSFLWCVSRAANEIPELRQRVENDDDGIVEYGYCRTSHTVARENGTYSYCQLDSRMPIEEFLPYAVRVQEEAKNHGNIEENEEEAQSLFFISTVPWLNYSALIQPVPFPADSNPRITWGKYVEKDHRIIIPVSILCHHALVDGRHLAAFYAELDRELLVLQN